MHWLWIGILFNMRKGVCGRKLSRYLVKGPLLMSLTDTSEGDKSSGEITISSLSIRYNFFEDCNIPVQKKQYTRWYINFDWIYIACWCFGKEYRRTVLQERISLSKNRKQIEKIRSFWQSNPYQEHSKYFYYSYVTSFSMKTNILISLFFFQMYYDFKIKETKRYLIKLLMILVVIIVVHFVISGALSCVTQKGCLRSWCKLEWLNEEYKAVVLSNVLECSNVFNRWIYNMVSIASILL